MNSASTYFKIGFTEKEKQNKTKPQKKLKQNSVPSQEAFRRVSMAASQQGPTAMQHLPRPGQLLGTHWAPAGRRPKYSSACFTFLLAQQVRRRNLPWKRWKCKQTLADQRAGGKSLRAQSPWLISTSHTELRDESHK